MADDFDLIAEQLTKATRQGDLAGAYRLVRDYYPAELQQIALRAGFSCISLRRRSAFMEHLQSQIAEAARRRTDGYGLRTTTHKEV